MPALDVKVVPADTDRFGEGHGFNTSPSDGTPAAIAEHDGEDPRQGAAARRHGARRRAGHARVGQRRLGRAATESRRSRTSRSTRTAPARCRRASRAASTRRPSTGISRARDLDVVERPSARRTAPSTASCPSGLLDAWRSACTRRRRRRAGRTRSAAVVPAQRQLAVDPVMPVVAADRRRTERDVPLCRTSSSIVWRMLSWSSSSSVCIPPVPSRRAARSPSAVSSARAVVEIERRLPGGDVEQEVVPRLRGRAAALRLHRERRVVGSESAQSPGAYIPPMATELDHTFTTDKPIDESYASILDLERLVPAVEGGSVIEAREPEQGQGRDPRAHGRDVDEVHRHRRGGRAGRRRAPRGHARGSRESGGTGHANAEVTFQLHDGGGTSTPTRRSPARPRRWARASWSACSTR